MYSQYLSAAQSAVWYVKRTMDFGADNKFLNNLKHLLINKMALNEARRQVDNELSIMGIDTTKDTPENWQAAIEAMASAAKSMGAGNCGEQSALAFRYLKDHGIRPIDYVSFTDRDHAFVVVGSPIEITLDNFKDWSVDSVLCDPWRGRAEMGGMLAVRYSSTRIASKWRLE